MKNKKGVELAIRTIVIFTVAILVLIMLVFWLNSERGMFSGFLKNFRGTSNVDEVVDACNTFYTSNRVYSYCCDLKEVKAGGEEFELTCNQLRDKNFTSDRISKLGCEEVQCVK